MKLAAVFVLAMILSMSGCQTAGEDDGVITIGVVQLVTHRALDAAYDGFVAALADNGYRDGYEIRLDFHNALGEIANLSTICDRFVSNRVDMILAITTPAAQVAASKTETIPIVGTAITSFENARLVDSNEAPGGNVTGSSDMNPIAAQIGLIRELMPDAQTLGFIYNSSEANSVLQIGIAREQATLLGFDYVEVTVTNTNDVYQAMQSLVSRCDVIYIPTDNTLASAMATVQSVTIESGTPTFCADTNMTLEGGFASMGINYFDLGYDAGLMAIEIINGADPATMPIRFATSSDVIVINGFMLDVLGFELPEKYLGYVFYPEE